MFAIEVYNCNRRSQTVEAIKWLRETQGLPIGGAQELFNQMYSDGQTFRVTCDSEQEALRIGKQFGTWGLHYRFLMNQEMTTEASLRNSTSNLEFIAQFDAAIRRDPAKRGLIGLEVEYGPLCPGHLAGAAAELAAHATHIGIVTGFFIPKSEPPAAETDGPLGAVLLAKTLADAGIKTTLITDRNCLAALRVTAAACAFPLDRVVEYPDRNPEWRKEFFTTGLGNDLSHLLAIERVGPNHTPESLQTQSRTGPVPLADYESKVPAEHRDHCHNMRGEIIDEYTADTHRLFEDIARFHPHAKTIGIGDGANEIGMGLVPWEQLEQRLSGPQSGRVPCRIATAWNILAGTSNWGGYALAAATLLLRGQTEVLRSWTCEQQARVLETLVKEGPAVDGALRRQDVSVDGLPFLTYIQPWAVIRQLLSLPE